jgi:hypothetical protein
MLLFSRVVTLTGNPREAVPWAIGINEYVNANSDLDVSLWSCNFGYPIGTVAWSTVVESQVALADGTAKLLVDDGYFDQIENGREFAAQPGQDFLRELVHGEPGDPPPIGAVATITTATALVDRMADAVGWGVEIAQYVTAATGAPVSVLTNVYGQMGEITWVGVQPDLDAAEAVRLKLNSDMEYLGRMAATKELYVPASGHVANVTRIG